MHYIAGDSALFINGRGCVAIASYKDEIATLPLVARNDAFIFNIITKSVP